MLFFGYRNIIPNQHLASTSRINISLSKAMIMRMGLFFLKTTVIFAASACEFFNFHRLLVFYTSVSTTRWVSYLIDIAFG